MPTRYQPGSMDGLPPHARQRLSGMRQNDQQKGLFTSDLSINEFLLIGEAGFDPVGMVVGSSIYHIGWQLRQVVTPTQNQELETLTGAMYHARDLAMTRMEEEADQLGADGVVGVRLDIGRYEWGENLAEFIAIGTAVRYRGSQRYRSPNGRPFTSDLSGQDFYTLLRAGYWPAGLVMGNCVYHVGYQGLRQWFKQIGQNSEMPTFTEAIYEARELALGRMQKEATDIQADGIVGAQIVEKSHGWDSHVIEFFAVGTAVIRGSQPVAAANPQLVLPLWDPSTATA